MPPILTIFIILLAGFCLFGSVYFFLFYLQTVQKFRDRLAFAFTSLFGFAFALSILMCMHSPDVTAFRLSLLTYLVTFQPTFLAVLWFTAYYTGYQPRRFLWVMTALMAVFTVWHLARPYGLLSDGIALFSTQALPWGEEIVRVRLIPSRWVFPWYAFLYVGLGYCLIAAWKYVRLHRGKAGKGFLFCIVISILSGFFNLRLDLGLSDGPYASEVAIIAFLAFMTVDLSREWRRQEELFTEVFDAQTDGIFIHDAETGAVLQVNRAACRMFGATAEELGKAGSEVFSAPARDFSPDQALAHLRRAVEEGPQVFEWRSRRMDGTLFWSEISLRSATLGGRPRVIAVVRDITERRLAEMAVRESERRFANLVKSSPVGMQFFHFDHGKLLFMGANPAADRLLRTDHQALAGRPFEEAFPDVRRDTFVKRLRHTALTGEPWRSEWTRTRDGHPESVYEILAAQTEPESAVVMYLDITERRRMERERLRDEIRMQEAQRLESLGMMAGGVAHDFNNILMAVKGNVETLEKGKGTADPEVFSDIAVSIQRASELCHQLLAYAGRNRLQPVALDLRQVVRETAKVVAAGTGTRARMVFNLPERFPLVNGDAIQIRQVVLNLMMNAVEALGDGGGQVTVSLGLEGGAVRLDVADTGCGMSEETSARIFEPFFTTKFTGRGLGLAAVQGILRSHNGSIEVHSRPGEGTTMTVRLPAAAEKAPMTEEKTRVVAERFGGRALLVDDEADVRRVTRRMLERLGIQVVEAENGREGLERFRNDGDAFVGVLLDLTMPGMDGLETYRALAELRPGLPALLISGYGMEEMRDRLREYPAMTLVQKPFGQKELAKGLTDIGWPLAAMPPGSEEEARFFEMATAARGTRLPDEAAEVRLPGIRASWRMAGDGSVSNPSGAPLPVGLRDAFQAPGSAWVLGPVAAVLRDGKAVVEDDLPGSANPWSQAAERGGIASAAVFPWRREGEAPGVRVVLAFDKGYFTPERMRLLEDWETGFPGE